MDTQTQDTMLKSGYVVIVGRPNVGKSSLMNALIGVRVSIATPRPQTTRNRIIGIVTDEQQGQIAFVDTPGIHAASDSLNRRMVDAAWEAAEQTHAALFVVDVGSLMKRPEEPLWGLDKEIYDGLAKTEIPIVLAINKVDKLRRKEDLIPILTKLQELYAFEAMIPVSALKKRNLTAVRDELFKHLPESENLYDDDLVTARSERFTAGELIREQVFLQTRDEVPYGTNITVETLSEDLTTDRLFISAVIHVEREPQKGIIIGRGGERLRDIGKAARKELQRFFNRSVHLELFVRVQPRWTENERDLQDFGFGKDDI